MNSQISDVIDWGKVLSEVDESNLRTQLKAKLSSSDPVGGMRYIFSGIISLRVKEKQNETLHEIGYSAKDIFTSLAEYIIQHIAEFPEFSEGLEILQAM